jgi:hypothetical protein
MSTLLLRFSVLVILVTDAAVTSPSTAAEPPRSEEIRKNSFTAFSELGALEWDKDKLMPIPELPKLPADASPLRKVRHAQATAGLLYLHCFSERILKGAYTPDEFLMMLQMACETYRVAAEAEETLADRVPWYEERVRAMKLSEQCVEKHVNAGSEASPRLALIGFFRLQTEVELYRLKDEVAKTGKQGRKLTFKEVNVTYDNVKKLTSYTAFPKLEPLKKNNDTNEQQKDDPWDGLPVLGDKPSLLRQAQWHQACEGLRYLFRLNAKLEVGSYTMDDYASLVRYSLKTNRSLAELEDLANRPRWYEQSIVAMKELERFLDVQVKAGVQPTQPLLATCFQRYQTEAELLALTDEIAKSGAKPTAPGKRIPFGPNIKQEPFTAFPNLGPDIEYKTVQDESGKVKTILVKKKPAQFPELPNLTADAPPLLRRALLEQVREGVAYCTNTKNRINRGTYAGGQFFEYVLIMHEVCRAAAELEEKPEARMAWHETGIREFKNFERYIRIRVEVGSDPSQRLDLARFHRFQAEIDLLKLKAKLEKENKK